MGDRLDRLFQEWHRLGGAVLLAEVDPSVLPRPPEEVIAESTAHCRESGRLTWVVLDWLICHIEASDERMLIEKTARCGDLPVLGVLCDAAHQRRSHPKFERLMGACLPHPEVVPFFHRVARSRLASRLARENGLDVFRRWNFICAELRYLESDAGRAAPGASPARRRNPGISAGTG